MHHQEKCRPRIVFSLKREALASKHMEICFYSQRRKTILKSSYVGGLCCSAENTRVAGL